MFRHRPESVSHGLALALTAGIGTLLLATRHPTELTTPAAEAAIQVALEPEPSPPAPAASATEPVKPVRRLVHREIRQPAASLAAAEVSSTADFLPAQDPPIAAAAAAPPTKPPSGTIDSQYAATLRSNIDSRTAPPTSAQYRLLRPHGEVRVNFTLDRSGMMISSELARSSGSNLLDHHAIEIVRNGHYPPFPGNSFQGESRHSFLITLEFHS